MADIVAPQQYKKARDSRKQLAFAVSSVVALGLCAAIFVASNQEDGDAISNILNPAMRTALAQVALARTSKLVLGAGQEDADMKAIQTAWATFQDSENASVIKELAGWNITAEESNVAAAVADMKALGLETKAEDKMIKKFHKSD
mmetsp:Transcript_65371/g.156127  ORF Transcript_65371/g.156127 Transcript_65371/m.156127 type:complete len:145 (+) Transcript_65371:1-435(+)